MGNNHVEATCALYALTVSALVAVLMGLAGCSFGVEVQYHGKTGIDNRTQTRLVVDGDEEIVASRKGKY